MWGNGELVMVDFGWVFNNAVAGSKGAVDEKEAEMMVPWVRIAVESLYQKVFGLCQTKIWQCCSHH